MDLRFHQRNVNCVEKNYNTWVVLYSLKTKGVCVKPLGSSLEAIQKLKPPTKVKGCRSYTGMVNFFSLFCPELQKLLKPIYNLTRKGRQFMWGEEQQLAFEEIKCRSVKPPVLHLPSKKGKISFIFRH